MKLQSHQAFDLHFINDWCWISLHVALFCLACLFLMNYLFKSFAYLFICLFVKMKNECLVYQTYFFTNIFPILYTVFTVKFKVLALKFKYMTHFELLKAKNLASFFVCKYCFSNNICWRDVHSHIQQSYWKSVCVYMKMDGWIYVIYI